MSEIALPEPVAKITAYLSPTGNAGLASCVIWGEDGVPAAPTTLYTAEQVRQLLAAERERCARVCDARVIGDHNREDEEAKRCAAAIRKGTA